MKLSPAQRKVLEVMAEGREFTRTVWGSTVYDASWDGPPTDAKAPNAATISKLITSGLLVGRYDGRSTHVYTITPKGREALK
jgi:hypothetical protein